MLKKPQKRWRIVTTEGNKKIALNKEEKKNGFIWAKVISCFMKFSK